MGAQAETQRARQAVCQVNQPPEVTQHHSPHSFPRSKSLKRAHSQRKGNLSPYFDGQVSKNMKTCLKATYINDKIEIWYVQQMLFESKRTVRFDPGIKSKISRISAQDVSL